MEKAGVELIPLEVIPLDVVRNICYDMVEGMVEGEEAY